MGRLALELAQAVSHVALALHKARSSIPLGVTSAQSGTTCESVACRACIAENRAYFQERWGVSGNEATTTEGISTAIRVCWSPKAPQKLEKSH